MARTLSVESIVPDSSRKRSSGTPTGSTTAAASPQPFVRRLLPLDTRVEQNFRRLVGESVQQLWSPATRERTAGQIVEELVKTVNDPLARLLPGLVFEGPGARSIDLGSRFMFPECPAV